MSNQDSPASIPTPENFYASTLSGCTLSTSILSSIFGPSSSLKLLSNSSSSSHKTTISLTNDGATVLKNLQTSNHILLLLSQLSINQDSCEGDGTTSVSLLASLLIQKGVTSLVNNELNRSHLVKGYQLALQKCVEVLDTILVCDNQNENDNQIDGRKELFVRDLVRSVVGSKVVGGSDCLDLFVDICIDAVNCLKNNEKKENYKNYENSNEKNKNNEKSKNEDSNSSENGNNNENSNNTEKSNNGNNNDYSNNSNDENSNNNENNTNTSNNFNDEDIFNDNDIDLSLINIIKVEGTLSESFFVKDGFILEKDILIPEPIHNPRILLANTQMDHDKIKIYGAKAQVSSVKDVSDIEQAEKDRMKDKIIKMIYNHNETQNITNNNTANNTPQENNLNLNENKKFFDVFINRQLMYDYPKQIFIHNKITPIDHVDFCNTERLSKLLNTKIISSFYSALKKETLGTCKKIENITLDQNNQKRFVKFSGVKKGSGTIVLKGSSKDLLDEAERSVHDALCVLKLYKNILPGAGCTEIILYNELMKYSSEIENKALSKPIKMFAECLSELPKIIAKNNSMDGEEIKAILIGKNMRGKKENNNNNGFYGVDIVNKGVCDVVEKGIFDSYTVKKRMLKCAGETAMAIVRCDNLVVAPPRNRERM